MVSATHKHIVGRTASFLSLSRAPFPPPVPDFRGSELQNYFSRILENNLKALVKPQYVDHIPKAVKGKVGPLFREKDQRERAEIMLGEMDLKHLVDRSVDALSGGELQRFTIGIVCVQEADVYMFDEPSSYLDVKQRLRAALTIRSLVSSGQGGSEQTYVLVVEHDLAVLDYLSDYICCLYGTPSAYGVVTMPFSVREGINIFLAGFVPTENLRFRDEVCGIVRQGGGGSGGLVNVVVGTRKRVF